jgi:hypothetical protein
MDTLTNIFDGLCKIIVETDSQEPVTIATIEIESVNEPFQATEGYRFRLVPSDCQGGSTMTKEVSLKITGVNFSDLDSYLSKIEEIIKNHPNVDISVTVAVTVEVIAS